MSRHKREREAPEVGAMAARVVRALVRRAEGGDTQALEELIRLDDLLPAAIRDAGAGLHRFGYSFTELGNVAGVSRQAARERFGTSDTPSEPENHAAGGAARHDAPMGVAQ